MEDKEKVKYKFGKNEIDLNTYIRNVGNNVQAYVERQNWSQGQKEEFMNSYNQYIAGLEDQLANNTGRFSADDFGNITDNSGILGSKDNDGIDAAGSEYYYNDKGERITTDDYNALKDKKKKNYKTFRANDEVTTYLNLIGKKVVEKLGSVKEEEKKGKEKFDISKHGFVADWQRRNSASGEQIDLAPYLDLDAYDPETKKRSRQNRLQYLSKQIEDYLKNLSGDYDFEGTPYKSMDEYKAKLTELLDHMSDNNWTNADMRAANQAGIGGSFYNNFFTEDENPNITDEQRKLAEEEEKAKLQKAKWEEEINRRLGIYDQHKGVYTSDRPYYITHAVNYTNDDGTFDITRWADSFSPTNPYYKDLVNKVKPDPTNYLNFALKNPYSSDFSKALQYIMARGIARQIDETRYYIPQVTDRDTQSVLIYEPTTRKLYRQFIGDVPELWDAVKRNFNEANGYVKRSDRYLKEGGIIEFQLGGEFDIAGDYKASMQQALEQRAAVAHKEVPEQKADERRIGTFYAGADPTAANPDTSFSDVEYMRLGSAAADIVSAVSAFIPGVGTAVSAATGVGSSLANLWADISDDGVSGWQAAKNFGMNIGMDIAGLIPGGGAASKTAKIVKSVSSLLPKVALVYGTMATAKNSPEILASIQKAIDEPTKLTVQDWQNISQAISVITGGSQVAGAAYQKRKGSISGKLEYANKGKTKDSTIAVDAKDSAGNTQTLLFKGDDAKAIIAAKKKNDIDAVNGILAKYEGTKDFKVSTDYKFGITKGDHWYKPNIGNTGKGKMNIFDVKNDSKGAYIERGWATADTYIDRNYLANHPLYGKKNQTVAHYDTQVAKRKQDIIDEMKVGSDAEVRMKDKTAEAIDKQQQKLDDAKAKLGTNKSSDIQAKLDAIANARNASPKSWDVRSAENQSKEIVDLGVAKQDLTNLQNQLDILNGKNRLTKAEKTQKTQLESDIQTKEQDIARIEQEIATEKEWLDANSDATIADLQQKHSDYSNWEKEIQRRNSGLTKLRDWQKRWADNRTNPFISKQYNDFMARNSNPDGTINLGDIRKTKVTRDEFNEILRNAGILFKKGGSLNLSTVRKFKQAGKISNTRSTANWYSDMFTQPEMQTWLNTFNKNNYQDFNSLQDSWSTNRQATGYAPGISHVSKNQGVWDRQGLWNNTGTNAAIERAVGSNKIKRAGTTGDNAQGGYQDGFFGEQEYLRHGGTEDSWKGRENELEAFRKNLASKELTYTLDKNGMYKLGLIQGNTSANTGSTTSQVLGKSDDTQIDASENQLGSLTQRLLNFNLSPTLKYGLPRTLYSNYVNRKMTDMAIANERPFLQNPFYKHRYVTSDLDAEMQGQRAAAKLYNMTNKAMTSDADKQQAAMFEGFNKGQDYITAGKEKSNLRLRDMAELALQWEIENNKNLHDTATQNRLAMLQTLANKNKYEMAYESKKHSNWDTLFKQFEYDARVKDAENKSYADAFTRSDISNYVTSKLGELAEAVGSPLDPKGIELYQQVKTGVLKPSDIAKDAEQYKLFQQAALLASDLESEQLRQSKGIPASKWAGVRARLTSPEQEYIHITPYDKNGAKITVAGIKAKTADAERFQKSIKESLDRHEKILDRVSKSLYGYIKQSIVK